MRVDFTKGRKHCRKIRQYQILTFHARTCSRVRYYLLIILIFITRLYLYNNYSLKAVSTHQAFNNSNCSVDREIKVGLSTR